jgi:hypothetical protein
MSTDWDRKENQRTATMPPGTRVRSHFRARWTGIVVAHVPNGPKRMIPKIKVTHDRNGNLLRKPIYHTYSSFWLTIVDE